MFYFLLFFYFNFCASSCSLLPSGTTLDVNDVSSCYQSNFNTYSSYITTVNFNTNLDFVSFDMQDFSQLREVVFTVEIDSIDYSFFSGCSNLVKVTFKENVDRISSYAFEDTGLTDIYYYGTEEPYVSYGAFSGVNPIVHVREDYTGDFGDLTLDPSLEPSGDGPSGPSDECQCFATICGCQMIFDELALNNQCSQNEITEHFSRYSKIYISNELQGCFTFQNFYSLKELEFTAKMNEIPSNFFYGWCSSLRKVTFKEDVTSIYSNAFGNTEVQDIYYYGSSSPSYVSTSAFPTYATVHVSKSYQGNFGNFNIVRDLDSSEGGSGSGGSGGSGGSSGGSGGGSSGGSGGGSSGGSGGSGNSGGNVHKTEDKSSQLISGGTIAGVLVAIICLLLIAAGVLIFFYNKGSPSNTSSTGNNTKALSSSIVSV